MISFTASRICAGYGRSFPTNLSHVAPVSRCHEHDFAQTISEEKVRYFLGGQSYEFLLSLKHCHELDGRVSIRGDAEHELQACQAVLGHGSRIRDGSCYFWNSGVSEDDTIAHGKQRRCF